MAKGPSEPAERVRERQEVAPVNTDAPWPGIDETRLGYGASRSSCTDGRPTTLVAGSMTRSTSPPRPSPIDPRRNSEEQPNGKYSND